MKHTTEEYLAWIDNKLEILKEPLTALEVIYFAGLTNSLRISLLANRDVLVRHEGEMLPTGSYPYESSDQYESYQCNCCRVDFPCPTYLDIAQRLDEVM